MDTGQDLIDYLVFFEVEPEVLSPEVGWYYGAKFASVRGNDRIVAVIAPGDAEFSFRWWQGEILRADLNLKGVVEWRLECDTKKEVLRLKFEQAGIGHFALQLKPEICTSWVTTWT